MKNEEQIKAKIGEIEKDSRYQSGLIKPATIIENAPLALIQLSMEAKVEALSWVLENEKRVEKGGKDD